MNLFTKLYNKIFAPKNNTLLFDLFEPLKNKEKPPKGEDVETKLDDPKLDKRDSANNLYLNECPSEQWDEYDVECEIVNQEGRDIILVRGELSKIKRSLDRMSIYFKKNNLDLSSMDVGYKMISQIQKMDIEPETPSSLIITPPNDVVFVTFPVVGKDDGNCCYYYSYPHPIKICEQEQTDK